MRTFTLGLNFSARLYFKLTSLNMFLNVSYGNLVPAICKLIYTIFSSSLQPSNCAQSYLKPLTKKGDSVDRITIEGWSLGSVLTNCTG